MEWRCGAITNGVSVFPDGRIRPCCNIDASYSKPAELITDPDRFKDLNTGSYNEVCISCKRQEEVSGNSGRKMFNSKVTDTKSIQFLDFRNSNQCNQKCRYCNPHFSNQIAKELNYKNSLVSFPVSDYYENLLVDSVQMIYFAGGEPLIMRDHYEILERLIKKGYSSNISLMYSTNLSVLHYKDIDIISLWQKFKNVNLMVSLDAVGPAVEYIRSGSNWDTIDANLSTLIDSKISQMNITITPVLSVLNVWFLPELVEYVTDKGLGIEPFVLYGPDILSLSVLPKDLKDLARTKLLSIKEKSPRSYAQAMLLLDSDEEHLFNSTIRHILLLDSMRDEKLFQCLPFKEHAISSSLKFYEYE